MATRTILAAVTDLMFQSRLEQQARALGYEVSIADSDRAVESGLGTTPSLVVVDLHAMGLDWRRAVELAKERRVPVLAFGRHTEAALLRDARAAGCDKVVPRSTFVEELPEFVRELATD